MTSAPSFRSPLLQTLIGVGTMAVGAAMAVGATGIRSDAGYSGVGPNFLPMVVSLALFACGLAVIVEARSGGFRNMEEPSGADRGDWWGFAWVSAGLLVNAALINHIGFILSNTLCFVLAVQGFRIGAGRADRRPATWLLDTATGALIAAPVYWMFGQLLAINLPGLTDTGWL